MSFRDVLPVDLQEIVQNGLLDRVFEDALVPVFLYDNLAEIKPWGAHLGAQAIMTKSGLMPVSTTPITGADATAATYGFEQYSLKMDQYASSIDTNMAMSALALASKFAQDNKTLAINAAQSLNIVAQNALYNAYGVGTTYLTAAISTSSTSAVVADATGFAYATGSTGTVNQNTVSGALGQSTPVLVPVSASNPISVTVNGVANTVTGVSFVSGTSGPGTLTLGTAVSSIANGSAVINTSNAPVQYRPNAKASAAQLVSSDVATLSLFQNAVTRLRAQNVPTVDGAYVAHVHPASVNELFQDQNFLLAYRGRAESPAYQNFRPGDSVGTQSEFMGRFSGIDWFMNTVTPSFTNPSGVTVYRPIVSGHGSLIKGPFEAMGDLINMQNAGANVQVDMIGGVARIWRAPLDRLGQVLTSTWSWIGGYTVGTDLLTGDSAAYKRSVVLEHA